MLGRRRNRGMRLLAAGLWPARIALRMRVTRHSVGRWTKPRERGGIAAQAPEALSSFSAARSLLSPWCSASLGSTPRSRFESTPSTT